MHLATASAYCSRFHKGLKTLLNLKFYKMQIELHILASQPLTAPPLIADVESCNLTFINADCFDHLVAILCGALPAPHRRSAVTAIPNVTLYLAQHTMNAAWLPLGCPSMQEEMGSRFALGSMSSQEAIQTVACSPILQLTQPGKGAVGKYL